MEKEQEVFCPECGQAITEEDRRQGNVTVVDFGQALGMRECHRKCRLITK